jgi:hypothetical protein
VVVVEVAVHRHMAVAEEPHMVQVALYRNL